MGVSNGRQLSRNGYSAAAGAGGLRQSDARVAEDSAAGSRAIVFTIRRAGGLGLSERKTATEPRGCAARRFRIRAAAHAGGRLVAFCAGVPADRKERSAHLLASVCEVSRGSAEGKAC